MNKNIYTKLIVIVALLSIASFLLIAETVGEEPFLKFRVRHACSQLIAATVVLVLWLELFIWTIYKIVKGLYNKRLILLLLWILFVLFWLAQTPFTYISDIIKFQSMTSKKEVAKLTD
jgi:hypothetical protein